MVDPEFEKLLTELHHEIEHTHNLTDKERNLLRDINKDIRKLLAHNNEEEENLYSLTIERLTETVELMEVTHPTLTNMMNKLLAILSNAGI
jgi:hypothetical protein